MYTIMQFFQCITLELISLDWELAPDGNKGLYYNIGSADSRAGSNINLHNNEWRFAVISKDVGSNREFLYRQSISFRWSQSWKHD